jgi:hypothetical protein
MSMQRVLVLAGAVVCLSMGRVSAQTEYLVTFRGVSYQTNAAGSITTSRFTERNLLQEAAQAGGITDTKSLALVYHVRGNALGDTIDVVDASNGQVLDTLFGFYFGQDFGRMSLTNTNGTQHKRLDYIYTKQNSHSLGSAVVTKSTLTDRKGNARLFIQGQMQYLVTPKGNEGQRICTATFTTGRALF